MTIHLVEESKTSLVSESLVNHLVAGVIWINDPHLVFEGKELLGGHLVGSDGRHLPKSIFTSAHADLQFILPLTCHQSGFLSTYDPGLNIPFITKSENMHLRDDDVRFDLKSLMTLSSQIQAQLDQVRFTQSRSLSAKRAVELEMEIYDLKSSQFDYVVTINQQFFSSFGPAKSEFGIIQAKQKLILKGLLDRDDRPLEIELFQDDYLRKRGSISNVLDDILVKNFKVIIDGKIAYEKDVLHLGDDEFDIDSEIYLNIAGPHIPLMLKTPVQKKLSITLPIK